MDAKAMSKVAQSYKKMEEAQNGVKMGKILKAIIEAATLGENKTEVDILDDGLEKYLTGLNYKIDNASKKDKTVISW